MICYYVITITKKETGKISFTKRPCTVYATANAECNLNAIMNVNGVDFGLWEYDKMDYLLDITGTLKFVIVAICSTTHLQVLFPAPDSPEILVISGFSLFWVRFGYSLRT